MIPAGMSKRKRPINVCPNWHLVDKQRKYIISGEMLPTISADNTNPHRVKEQD
jgi:hypothetical protein